MITPFADRILLKMHEKKQGKEGIILLESNEDVTGLGTVVQVGTGRINNVVKIGDKKSITDNKTQTPLGVNKGDVILVEKMSATPLIVAGAHLHCIKEEDILAIVEVLR